MKRFKDLQIGDKFWVYGDQHLNYDYPKMCECIKVGDTTGEEIDGIRFSMDSEDFVDVK